MHKNSLDFMAIGDITTDAFIQLDAGAHISAGAQGVENLCMNFGDKIEYESIEIVHGVGNSANAAVSAARLGLNTALDTYVGNDSRGKNAQEIYKKEGIFTKYIHTDSRYTTHYHFVLRHGAERTILIRHNPWPYQKPKYDTVPRWIYFSSIGSHGEYYHDDLASYCKEHNVKLAFQPGTFQINLTRDGKIHNLLQVTEIFFCNKEEAQRIVNSHSNDVLLLLSKIQALGPSTVVITDGPRGAYAKNNEGTWMVPMYPDPKPPVDRTGAGDAFSSTVTAMLALGMSLPDALIRGPINSMSVVQYIGAQRGLLSRNDLEKYLANAPEGYIIRKL